MDNGLVVGIDIGGTNTKIGIVDADGNCIKKTSLLTEKYIQVNGFIDAIAAAINMLLSDLGKGRNIKGIGIGAPNGNFFKGTIEHAPNLSWKGIIPFTDMMKVYFNVPVGLTNDANAAAMGEMIYGAAKGKKDFIVITLGTGLGSGIVVSGEMVYGHDGFAGEIGHTIIVLNGRQCGCGRKGCLETYSSATGLIQTYKDLLMKSTATEQQNGSHINGKYIYELAKNGNEVAIEAFNYTGEMLGIGLANSVAYTSPEVIYLFGGLAKAQDLIFIPTIKSFEENLMNIYKGKTKILPSGLNSGNAAILGAASLIGKNV
jgi:glucokinase